MDFRQRYFFVPCAGMLVFQSVELMSSGGVVKLAVDVWLLQAKVSSK